MWRKKSLLKTPNLQDYMIKNRIDMNNLALGQYDKSF